MLTDIHEVGQGKWRDIFYSLGLPEETVKENKPCVFCSGDDRASLLEYTDGTVYFCRQCKGHTPIDVVMKVKGWTFRQAADEIRKIAGHIEPHKPKPIDASQVNNIIRGCRKDNGEIKKYLANRGITSFPLKDVMYHPSLSTYADEAKTMKHTGGAMVAMIRNVKGELLGIHKTFITNGYKAPIKNPKKMQKIRELKGGTIQLFPATKHIGLAEGIETALAVHQRFNIPVWACYSAHGLESVELPDFIEHVFIFSDNDDSYTGQAASYALAKRLTLEGKIVNVFMAEMGDFADYTIVEKRGI
jgi:putative DNA primase/helicase